VAATKRVTRARASSNSHSTKFKNVLGVFAHPDDPDFGAGGTIAKLVKDGARVTYAIVTDGSQGGEDPKQKDSELVAIREKEQKAAARVLGVKKVEFLGYKDGHLSPDLKLRHDIVRMIRKYKPELVITHTPGRETRGPFAASSRRGCRHTRSRRCGFPSGRRVITSSTSAPRSTSRSQP
jgi:LmbE family N-acetylglucosaminyl deacetylase